MLIVAQLNGWVGVTEFGSAFQHPFCGRKHSGGRDLLKRLVVLLQGRCHYQIEGKITSVLLFVLASRK